MNHYRLFGIDLASEIRFPELEAVNTPRTNSPRRISVFAQGYPPFPKKRLKKVISFYGLDYWLTNDNRYADIRCRFAGNFRVCFGKRTIRWKPSEGHDPSFVRVLLRGRILGSLLAQIPPFFLLHADAIEKDGKAILFCASMGEGKSTLAAFLLNHGFSLMSDDIGAITTEGNKLMVQAGAPELRLWPQSVRSLGFGGIKKEPLYPGIVKKKFVLKPGSPWRYRNKSAPLAAVYVLQRSRGSGVKVEDLKPRKAVVALLSNLYIPLVKDRKVSDFHFEVVARIAGAVPVRKLIYPSGMRHLPQVLRSLWPV